MLTAILLLASGACLVSILVGMGNPALVTPKVKDRTFTRKELAKGYFGMAVILLILAAAAAPSPEKATVAQAQAPVSAVAPSPTAEELAAKAATAEVERKAGEDSIRIRQAAEICRDRFRQSATHPSTVNFPIFDGLFAEFVDNDTGYVMIQRGPTAKNSYNLEIKMRMRCAVKDGTIISFEAVEAR